MNRKKIIIASLFIVVAALTTYHFMPKREEGRSTRWVTTTVSKQNIVQSVTATGTIEPVTQVDVGTQVSGILTTLYVDYNSVVKEGEVIAELDKSTLLLELNSNKNNVAIAKSKYEYELARYTRTKTLFNKGLVADSEYEESLYNYESAKNNYEVAENNLKRSETNLGYATIYSPIDGVVLSKAVEEGQTVASSFSTPTLFTIAADLKDMRVIVDVDEADIGNVKEGQLAKFTVDAYPLDIFEGRVTQLRQQSTISSNVVTYEVVISAANPDLKLKPGLTANVEIYVLNESCDTTVSAAALSFSPRMDGEADRSSSKAKQPTLWVLDGDQIKPVEVEIGVSNGVVTQVMGIDKDSKVIVGMESQPKLKSEASENGEENPFLPKRPGQK